MGFDWTKYLEFAECISNNSDKFPDKEACYRASVSRAYYAAFCNTCRYLEQADKDKFTCGRSHEGVRSHLIKDGDKLRRTIANQLKTFHYDRVKADYYDKIRDKNPAYLASKAIRTAKKILEELGELNELSAK